MDRGPLLLEYRPPRVHPILYAGIILSGLVFLSGGVLENLLRDQRLEVAAFYAAPVVVVALLMLLLRNSDTRIYAHGISPSRTVLDQARNLIGLGRRPAFVAWSELEAVYPTYYDVTGAFVSPFASSDGKVTQMGLGLEFPGGAVWTVPFTPSAFTRWEAESAGYLAAMDIVRGRFQELNRPLVPDAERLDVATRERLIAEAEAPFLGFFTILVIVAAAAPIIALLSGVLDVPVWASLPLGLAAPLGIGIQSWRRSRRRNAILNRVSRSMEFERTGPSPQVAVSLEQELAASQGPHAGDGAAAEELAA